MPHCNAVPKTVDHPVTKCDSVLGHDYMRRDNKVFKCIYLTVFKKFGTRKTKGIKSHSIQEVVAEKNVEIFNL